MLSTVAAGKLKILLYGQKIVDNFLVLCSVQVHLCSIIFSPDGKSFQLASGWNWQHSSPNIKHSILRFQRILTEVSIQQEKFPPWVAAIFKSIFKMLCDKVCKKLSC